MLDIFALIVLFVICATVISLVVLIGNIPGNIARQRCHPQSEAIAMLAWIGLLTMGLGWFAALVWSKTSPAGTLIGASTDDRENTSARNSAELEKSVQALEGRLQQLEAQS